MSTDLFRFEVDETDDSGDLQTLKGTGYAGEELKGVHRVMPHGLASSAPAGSHSLAIAARGERTLVAALGLEHPDKRQKNIGVGNTALYNADGTIWKLIGRTSVHQCDSCTITCGAVTVLIDGSGFHITGGTVTHNGKNVGATHIHTGVTPGAATTGVPA